MARACMEPFAIAAPAHVILCLWAWCGNTPNSAVKVEWELPPQGWISVARTS